MRMARVNVYLPDDLAQQVKKAGINVSHVAQEALRLTLAEASVNDWLDGLARLPPTGIDHDEALAALKEARLEFGASHG